MSISSSSQMISNLYYSETCLSMVVGDDTWNLFIWDGDIEQEKNVYKALSKDGSKINELEVVGILKEL